MLIDSVSPITSVVSEFTANQAERLNFADFIKAEVQEANMKLKVADEQVRALAAGETDNLHQVMLSISKAQTAFDFVVEVRNKLLESYQEVSKMQI